MCDLLSMGALMGLGGAGVATAGGAAAGAATIGGALQTIGAITAIGGSLYSGVQEQRNAKANVAAIEEQKATDWQMNAVEDSRTRRQFQSQIRQQSAELAARGIALDSPTARLLLRARRSS